MAQRLLCAAPSAPDHNVSRGGRRQFPNVFRITRAVALRSSSAHLRFWAPCNRQNAARRPPPPRPRQSPVAPRIVRSECGLARRLAKEDRHLRIAPRFFDRDKTPAIFVTSLVLIRARWFARSSGSTIAVAAWPSIVAPETPPTPISYGWRAHRAAGR